jgi:hypothetical protein
MARSINSPGVQIVETDLSNYQQIGGGTTVYVAGFAPQGPTDETLRITSVSELEQVYGTPQTAAERYFYHTSKQLLNSSASLLTTRLPYGSGLGDGFANNYSALLFPTTSASDEIRLGQPKYITLTEEQFNQIDQGNFTWGSLSAATPVTTTVTVVSTRTATQTTSAAVLAQIQLADPTPGTYTVQYNNNQVTFTFDVTGTQTTYSDSTIANYQNSILNAGVIILNKSKTAINEQYEGYYVSITDNSEFGANSDFKAVSRIYSLSAANDDLVNSVQYADVPNSRLNFALSGTKDTAGSNSISEVIEGVVDYQLNQPYYNDTLVLNVYKIRNSIYEPQRLTYSVVETHLGSLDSNKKTLAPIGGIQQSFFLENIVNQKSNNIKLLVNPNISRKINWTNTDSNSPSKHVRVDESVKALYPNSVYLPTYYTSDNKQIGDLPKKLERVLSFVEATENIQIDVVVDGGLSTIYTNSDGGNFDEAKYNDINELLNPASNTITDYKVIYSLFNNFVASTRKDCVFIADPLRQVFINGENTKILTLKGKTFSQNIYTPLKNLFESANSNYSVTYGNWVKVYDPFADKQVWLPFSGFAAAAYARTDTSAQPWIAPAGLSRGLITGVLDLGFNPNQKQRDFLYTLSVNPVVFFSSDGFVIFGQKTLQNKPSAFDRVNVRRLFLVLERATQNALKYFVFEPNSDFTRTRLKNTIAPIFELARNTDGLYDYLIICDERNNTPDVIDRNELAVDVYIKPVKAAEFILVNFIATRTGQNFQELI